MCATNLSVFDIIAQITKFSNVHYQTLGKYFSGGVKDEKKKFCYPEIAFIFVIYIQKTIYDLPLDTSKSTSRNDLHI